MLVHDAKPDYGLVGQPNSDARVHAVWGRFEDYGLYPRGAEDVRRIGFHGNCDPNSVDEVLGFRSSDFRPDMLAGLFFTGSGPAEQNGFEGFVGAAHALEQQLRLGQITSYTLNDILNEVRRRADPNGEVAAEEAIHEMTGRSILRKVSTRRNWYPWLDAVGQTLRPATPTRFRASRLDGSRAVVSLNLEQLVAPGRVLVIDYAHMDDQSYAVLLSYFLRECQRFRKHRSPEDTQPRPGVVQLVDEAHRIFDNDSRHGPSLAGAFERVMREGRSVDHSIILSLQNASQIPHRVMNNLNTKIVMRQNSKAEAEAATETMGKEFALQAMRLGTGHALVSMHESRAVVLAQMAPSPYELMRTDNASPIAGSPGTRAGRQQPSGAPVVQPATATDESDDDDIPF